ncbi:hypothetical protein NL529_27810, partial [Klebsiella pneumoniae]|nr:hypothetical protein [Klebsiella pneumoniae]
MSYQAAVFRGLGKRRKLPPKGRGAQCARDSGETQQRHTRRLQRWMRVRASKFHTEQDQREEENGLPKDPDASTLEKPGCRIILHG